MTDRTLAQVVDTEIASLWERRRSLEAQADLLKTKALYKGVSSELDANDDAQAEVSERLSALTNVYTTYNWTRAYIVPGGHVHKYYRCQTLWDTTVRIILPECSGLDEAEIVELAGDRACTICYPSAPVEVLKRPSRLFTRDELVAEKERQEKLAKRAAKEAAKLTVTYTEGGSETFGTTRSARLRAVDSFWWAIFCIEQVDEAMGRDVKAKAHRTKAIDIVTAVAEREGVRVDELALELAQKAQNRWDTEARKMARRAVKNS